jgi:3-oxoacyl-[acyl-carrier-protein] synthase II
MNGLLKTGGYSYLNFLRRKPDVVTSILSILFQCRGPNLSIVSACAAGSQAIGEAFRIIREGKAEVMIAAGCDTTLYFIGFIGFVLIKALSERYTTPQTASRPFDRKRNGFVMSEGAGTLILEDLEHALSRGAPVYGEILGYGSSADAYRITDTHPRGLGAILAMRGALEDAGLSPEDVRYINAHGTSTKHGDELETQAIKAIFGDHAHRLCVSSTKSMTGHLLGAAGGVEAVITVLCIHRGAVPPTINLDNPDPECDLDYVPFTSRNVPVNCALTNSFGFGGTNACLIFQKFSL